MKKVLCMMIVLLFVSASSYAADLANKITDTKLSNGVTGTYFSNATGAGNNDATDYVLSTAHTQGNTAYASGSLVSEVYRIQDLDAPAGSLVSSFSSTVFDSGNSDGWKAM